MRLLLLIGPPAVGKMSVGREIARRSDFRLFHNHHTIEPLIEVFGWGTPPFSILNAEFRRRVVEEAAAAELDLIFTFVWLLTEAEDALEVQRLIGPYVDGGGGVAVVELVAGLDVRLERNRGPERLAAKPTKRDLVWSEANVRSFEGQQLNTDPGGEPTPADAVLARFPHLRLDTTALSVEDAADRVLIWLNGLN